GQVQPQGGPVSQAPGSALSPSGPGYPNPPTAAVAPQGNLLHAVQPVSALTPTGQAPSALATFQASGLSTSAAAPVAASTFQMPVDGAIVAAAPPGMGSAAAVASVPARAGNGAVVALAGTGEAVPGVRSDSPTSIRIVLSPTAPTQGLLP